MWGAITGDGGGVGSSKSRDKALAKVNRDKTFSHVTAWEEAEKSKSYNKYHRKVAKITAWESTKKATSQATLKRAEETLEKQRASFEEKMKNEIAGVHKEAEEKRAIAEAIRGEELLHTEEMAAKYKVTGHIPKKFLCFEV